MKAFNSPLATVARLTSQQVSLQKLTLGRLAQQEAELNKKFNEIEHQRRIVTAGIIDSLTNSKGANGILSIQAAGDQLQEIHNQAENLAIELKELREQEESVYQKLLARESSLNNLLARKKAEHRKSQLALEQIELDQSFLACRFSASNPS
ncbi:hypothetical protein AB1L42_19575 [Thalassoglobus sp. JC818]|uniref:hypothetical protein n=1 Tax=Thalassoglobus sp. JC818 TaxID=3232136 RepID=UPI003458BB51